MSNLDDHFSSKENSRLEIEEALKSINYFVKHMNTQKLINTLGRLGANGIIYDQLIKEYYGRMGFDID